MESAICILTFKHFYLPCFISDGSAKQGNIFLGLAIYVCCLLSPGFLGVCSTEPAFGEPSETFSSVLLALLFWEVESSVAGRFLAPAHWSPSPAWPSEAASVFGSSCVSSEFAGDPIKGPGWRLPLTSWLWGSGTLQAPLGGRGGL